MITTADARPQHADELLQQVVQLLGILVLRGPPDGASQKDKILLLNSAGVARETIAKLTDASPQTVANRISEVNSASSRKKPSRKEAA